MSGLHPTLTAALAAEHHRDLIRTAGLARSVALATDTDDRHQHHSPTHRPAWWTRITAWFVPQTARRPAADLA